MTRSIVFLLFLSTAGFVCSESEDISKLFSIRVDRTDAKTGDEISLLVDVHQNISFKEDELNIILPDGLGEAEYAGQSSGGTGMSIFNISMGTSHRTIQYKIIPQKEGHYQLGNQLIIFKGQPVNTNVIQIHIEK
ncbi:MAG: hypothetical protein JW774_05570 [Candidatus Aureabacteria bacterium]|nr:hypothetical protein [Candidatus Auribacterota bacterium]